MRQNYTQGSERGPKLVRLPEDGQSNEYQPPTATNSLSLVEGQRCSTLASPTAFSRTANSSGLRTILDS